MPNPQFFGGFGIGAVLRTTSLGHIFPASGVIQGLRFSRVVL